MRDLLDHADLAGYAGQFVWLELSYDAPENHAFLTKYGAEATPTFFIIAPQDEQVAAMQTGAMSLEQLTQFLDRGASGASARNQTPADAALMRGDSLRAQQPAAALAGLSGSASLGSGQLAASATRRNLIRRGAARQ